MLFEQVILAGSVRVAVRAGRQLVDNSSGAADPEAAGTDRGTVLLLLVMELVDDGEDALALVVLELVGGFGAERVVGVGDVPAEPVVLDRGGGPFPA